MADATLRGTTLMQQQETTIHFDPSRGYTVGTIYKGISSQTAINLANYYQSIGVEVSLHQQFGIYTVVINDATQNNPIDNWQIVGNSERLDLFESPVFISAITSVLALPWNSGTVQGTIATLRYYLANNTPTHGSQATAAGGAFDTPSATLPPQYYTLVAFAGGIVERFYQFYLNGQTEFENAAYGGGYVLKHVTNAPARWTQNIADFNIGKIYSTAQLLTEVTDSTLWVYPLPNRLIYKINQIPVPAIQSNFAWGWLKQRSNEETASNNRINIITDYVLDLWSTDIYGTL